MLLQEISEERHATRPITIFSTDIDAQAIAFARAARYRKMEGVSAERLQRWFAKDKEDYCVAPAIRDMCVFSEHSVLKDAPFSRLDLLACRNVLIYFDQNLQHRVMRTGHYALQRSRPCGHTDIVTLLTYDELRNDVKKVLRTLAAVELRGNAQG